MAGGAGDGDRRWEGPNLQRLITENRGTRPPTWVQ